MLSPDETGPLSAGASFIEGPAQSVVSRRSMLRSTAIAGVAGLTAYSLASTSERAVASDGAQRGSVTSDEAGGDDAEQLVVHVRDVRSGQLDIFRGTSQTRVDDPEIAARLLRASRS